MRKTIQRSVQTYIERSNLVKKFLAGAILALPIICGAASAATISVSSYDNGTYSQSGYHSSKFTNIVTSESYGYRSFLAFDLSEVNLSNITNATLTFAEGNGRYSVDDKSILAVNFFDVSTDIGSLLSSSSTYSTEGIGTYQDLGSGTQYGTTTVQTTSSFALMPEVVASLNSSAITDIASALMADGLFAIGSTASSSSNAYFYLWNGFISISAGAATLTLTGDPVPAIPLPASGMLLLTGLGGLGVLRKWGALCKRAG